MMNITVNEFWSISRDEIKYYYNNNMHQQYPSLTPMQHLRSTDSETNTTRQRHVDNVNVKNMTPIHIYLFLIINNKITTLIIKIKKLNLRIKYMCVGAGA